MLSLQSRRRASPSIAKYRLSGVLIGVGSRRRSASQAIDLPSDGGGNLGRLFTADDSSEFVMALSQDERRDLNEVNDAVSRTATPGGRYDDSLK
jgi:hypothetical protein